MRACLKQELDALTRMTTPKKVRLPVPHRILAVELAEGDVGATGRTWRRCNAIASTACRRLEAERQANERLQAARIMQARVHEAEQAAVQGLAVMVDKLAASREPEASS